MGYLGWRGLRALDSTVRVGVPWLAPSLRARPLAPFWQSCAVLGLVATLMDHPMAAAGSVAAPTLRHR